MGMRECLSSVAIEIPSNDHTSFSCGCLDMWRFLAQRRPIGSSHPILFVRADGGTFISVIEMEKMRTQWQQDVAPRLLLYAVEQPLSLTLPIT